MHAHRTRDHCCALLSPGRIVGSSSTATAPLRRPRTSSCLTSPSASTWRVCSCSTTASPQRGADDANSLRRLASTHNDGGRLERRGSRASVPQAAEQQHLPSAKPGAAISWLGTSPTKRAVLLLVGRRIDACKADGSIPKWTGQPAPECDRQVMFGRCGTGAGAPKGHASISEVPGVSMLTWRSGGEWS